MVQNILSHNEIKSSYSLFGELDNYYNTEKDIKDYIKVGLRLGVILTAQDHTTIGRNQILIPSSNSGLIEVGINERLRSRNIDSKFHIISGDLAKIPIIFNRNDRTRSKAEELPFASKSIATIIDIFGAAHYAAKRDESEDLGINLLTLLKEYDRLLLDDGNFIIDPYTHRQITHLASQSNISPIIKKFHVSLVKGMDSEILDAFYIYEKTPLEGRV